MTDFTTPGLAFIPSTTTLFQTSSGAEPIATETAPIIPQSSLSESQQKLTISLPISVEYCDQVQVIWSGGNSPYSLVVRAPLQSCLGSAAHAC